MKERNRRSAERREKGFFREEQVEPLRCEQNVRSSRSDWLTLSGAPLSVLCEVHQRTRLAHSGGAHTLVPSGRMKHGAGVRDESHKTMRKPVAPADQG